MESHVGFMSLVVVWFFLLTHASGYDEVAALIDFKKHVRDTRNVLQSWDPTHINPCSWFHITCDNSKRVIRIDLGDAGLRGSISPALGNLANLQYLELYINKLIGSMPKELGNLTNLVTMDLYSNRLTGPIPFEFGQLRSLTTLQLQNNDLCGRVPVESLTRYARIKQFKVFNVDNNPRLCNPFKVKPENCPRCA